MIVNHVQILILKEIMTDVDNTELCSSAPGWQCRYINTGSWDIPRCMLFNRDVPNCRRHPKCIEAEKFCDLVASKKILLPVNLASE